MRGGCDGLAQWCKEIVKVRATRPVSIEMWSGNSDGLRQLAHGQPGRREAASGRARSDAGLVRLTGRDIAGLLWCGEMYGVRADLLAGMLGGSADVVRQVHVRWRRAGLAETGRLGPGPVWCWLTRAGLDACGLPYASYRPPLGRLAHVHAVGCVRGRWRTGMRGGGRGAVAQ